jgi:pimeloyl-ACP methyl ester carboxylesterase
VLPGVKFATARLATGVRLHYAEQGDAGGDPVVFLHGWPDSWFSFSGVLEELPRRVHAFVPDQRGFGDSERPDGPYRIDDFAADAVALLDALSIERATFVGHSFGSFVTRKATLTHPERVARMVLIGAGESKDSPVLKEVRAATADLPDPVPIEFAREFQAGTAFAPVPDAFFNRIVAESLKLPARLWREVFDSILAYDDHQDLARISAATLLIWGEHDTLFPRAHQDTLRAGIKGSRLTIYKDIGHCPNWEDPKRVAADLLDFLEQR